MLQLSIMPSPESPPQIPLKAHIAVAGKKLQEVFMHPLVYSDVDWDPETKRVRVMRFKENPEDSKRSLVLRAKHAKAILTETLLHPRGVSRFIIDKNSNEVTVKRESK